MKKVILFIGMSLDGYIAGKDGNVNWMQGQEADRDDMQSYDEFIKNVDTVVMGWNTYHQIFAELSPEKWMYEGLLSYVLTHRRIASSDEIRFIDENVCDLIKRIRQEDGKSIWICGGAGIIQPLMKGRLIDILHISVIPTILGGGIRLFEEAEEEIKLKLLKTQNYNGITDLVYELR